MTYFSESLVKELLKQKKYSEVDKISRDIVSSFKGLVLSMSQESLWRLIDEVTGGLGYTMEDKEVTRLVIYGTYISWAEAVKHGSKVLEIGTGLGRTCYSVLSITTPSLYLTIDVSPEILAIALYRNPYAAFQEALSNPVVKLCLCDVTEAILYIDDSFDHIIHDGGPNPNKNPALFSRKFLEKLVSILKPTGTLSIFGGKNRKWQDKLYRELKVLGLSVASKPIPYSPILVFHCIKK
ncbi:MAG: MnmC family methyltransferase [Candidatus Nezhaarchaeales archaeon]